eukprot:scaffold2765_cov128-Isochrysis_galbana.AAC.3
MADHAREDGEQGKDGVAVDLDGHVERPLDAQGDERRDITEDRDGAERVVPHRIHRRDEHRVKQEWHRASPAERVKPGPNVHSAPASQGCGDCKHHLDQHQRDR